MSTIASIDVRLFHIPLAEVLVDAKHGDHHIFELITATVHLEDGSSGTGYTYTAAKEDMRATLPMSSNAIIHMRRHDTTHPYRGVGCRL